jgi:hypothetical protein
MDCLKGLAQNIHRGTELVGGVSVGLCTSQIRVESIASVPASSNHVN